MVCAFRWYSPLDQQTSRCLRNVIWYIGDQALDVLLDVVVIHRNLDQTVEHGSICVHAVKQDKCDLLILPLDQILQMILQSLLRRLKHFCIPCKVYYSNLEQKMTWYVLQPLNISTCWRFHLSIISYITYLFALSCFASFSVIRRLLSLLALQLCC